MEEFKKLPKKKIVQYFSSDIAKGLFNGMLGNYLLYFFQPTIKSGLPSLLTDNKLFGFFTVMAIITGISKVVDAVTDPWVANMSDRCKSPNGRRMPFLRFAAIPYALCTVLIFYAPFSPGSVGNTIWVGFFVIAYYVFYTLFSIPHRALIPEIIPDPKERVGVYTISTVFFMGSSAIMYAAPMVVGLFKKAGMSPLWAYRTVFTIFGVVGLACLLLTAYAFNETDYLKKTHRPHESLIASFKLVFKNKNFVIFTLGDLFNYVAMAFFQTAMMYYITVLIGIPEAQSIFVMGSAIVAAICFFPIIMKVCRKYNKKTPLLVATFMFTALFAIIYFGDVLPLNPYVKGIGMGLLVAYPFAAINIIPQAVVSDIIQADSLKTSVNREGIYSATKTFIEKIAYAVAMVIVSSVLAIGAVEGEDVGLMGVKLTGIFAGGFSLLSAIFFTFYKDKEVSDYIRDKKAELDSIETEEG
ncbi:MAG: MFS transporter, partial [Clostridia bacterium]